MKEPRFGRGFFVLEYRKCVVRIFCVAGNNMAKPTNRHQWLGWILFVSYLAAMTYFMFFSDDFGRSGHTEYSYNLILFKEIKRFYRYRELLGMKTFLINIVGNVLCFVPFGLILPIISRRGKQWYNTFLLSFLFSLGIETVQLIFKVGSFDVDDIFLNTSGGIIGYIGYWLMMLLAEMEKQKRGTKSR